MWSASCLRNIVNKQEGSSTLQSDGRGVHFCYKRAQGRMGLQLWELIHRYRSIGRKCGTREERNWEATDLLPTAKHKAGLIYIVMVPQVGWVCVSKPPIGLLTNIDSWASSQTYWIRIPVGSTWASVFFKCFFDHLVVCMHFRLWRG